MNISNKPIVHNALYGWGYYSILKIRKLRLESLTNWQIASGRAGIGLLLNALMSWEGWQVHTYLGKKEINLLEKEIPVAERGI